MALRAKHGNAVLMGNPGPRIEVLPPDEQPRAVPAPPAPAAVPLVFRQDGRIADSTTAKELGRLGGLAKARRLRFVGATGLAKIAADSAFGPYRSAGDELLAFRTTELAQCAGGEVSSAASTMLASAALQIAGSRYCFDKFAETADPTWLKLGSSLANDARQNDLAAWEMATREAQARLAHAGSSGQHRSLLAVDDDEDTAP